jgi:hypothetical protein
LALDNGSVIRCDPAMGFSYTSSATESAVMQLLLATHPTLVHRDEICRELGEHDAVDDALARFAGLGLVNRLEDFFWASRLMIAAEEAATAHLTVATRHPRERAGAHS